MSVLLCPHSPGFRIEISPACSEKIKAIIKDHFSGAEGKKKINSDYLYGLLVLYDLTEQDKELEGKAIANIRKQTENESKGIYSYPSDRIPRVFSSLLLSDKLINKKDFIDALSESNHNFVKWLVEPKSYNYAEFNLDWLSDVQENMLKELVKDKETAAKIKKVFYEKYYKSKVNETIVDLVLRYFLNDGYYAENEDLDPKNS